MESSSVQESVGRASESVIETTVNGERVLNVLKHLRIGNITDAVGEFAEKFSFNDHALGLKFVDRGQLSDFLQKERELYPDSLFWARKVVATKEYVVAEWLLEYAIKEPSYGNVMRDVPISVQGVSIVRTGEGGIVEWSEYYDGLVSRRSTLTCHFTDWIDY
jgi:hypothetical protein